MRASACRRALACALADHAHIDATASASAKRFLTLPGLLAVAALTGVVAWPLAPIRASVPAVPTAGARRSAPAPHGAANVVFVLTDDLTADLTRFMPTVRRMRREGDYRPLGLDR